MRTLLPVVARLLRASMAQVLRRSSDARFVHRAHAVVLVSHGHKCIEVAHWIGETPRSIERWIQALESGGPDALHDHRHAGRPRRLTPGQMQQLATEVARPPSDWGYRHARWSGKLLARHITSRHAVALSARQCQRLLREFGHAPD